MSKAVGFKLSGHKRKKIINSSDDVQIVKEEIKSIEGNVVHSLVEKKVKPDLVIPLPAPLNPNGIYVPIKGKTMESAAMTQQSVQKETTDEKELTIEELAAREILEDMNGKSKDNSALLVIKTGADSNHTTSTSKKAPLLMANIAPELFGIDDDDKRFKADVELRAENMDVNSEAYSNVPIADFGAAMLRGMGWSGPSEDDNDKDKYTITPRDHRLGLGATPRPPDDNTKGKSKKEKEKEKNKWQKRAEEKLNNQELHIGSLVWLRSPSLVGKRAEVNAIAGVPGLNKIRVRLETTGELIDISKLDAVLLTDDELNKEPFKSSSHLDDTVEYTTLRDDSRKHQDKYDIDRQKRYNDANHGEKGEENIRNLDGKRERKRERDRDNNVDMYENREFDRDQDRISRKYRHGEDFDDEKKHDRKKSKKKNDNERFVDESDYSRPAGWTRTGIRVKIISKKVGDGKYYLQKGIVVDVYIPRSSSSKVASVRLDSVKSCVQDVKEKYLETVLPSEGGSCMILRGEHVGKEAVLIEKIRKKNEVSVQLLEDMDIIIVNMDDVAALA